jgi:hypothetical protein
MANIIDDLFAEVEAQARQQVAEGSDTVPSETVGSTLPQLDLKKLTSKAVLLIGAGLIALLIAVWMIVAFVRRSSAEHEHAESDAGTIAGIVT